MSCRGFANAGAEFLADFVVHCEIVTLGDHETVVAMLDEQLEVDSKLGIVTAVKPFVLAWTFADMEAFPRAREWAERLLHAAHERKVELDEARGHWIVAEVSHRTGDTETAESEVQDAIAMLQQICPLDVPGALATLANLRLSQNRPVEALAASEDGMARMKSMSGACSQFFRNAFLRLAHAEALDACGRHDDAARAIQDAKT